MIKVTIQGCLLFLLLATNIQAQTNNNRITPLLTVAPSIFAAGQTSNALLCISNDNATSAQRIQAKDTFTLTFDNVVGTVTFDQQIILNSSILTAADFGIQQGTTSNQILITYKGAIKTFPPGDRFCVRATIATPNKLGAG